MEATVAPAWEARARTHATSISAAAANSFLGASAYISSAVPRVHHSHTNRRTGGFLRHRTRLVFMRAPFARTPRRLVPGELPKRGRGDGFKCDVLVPGRPSPGESDLSEGEGDGENLRGPDGLRWRGRKRGSARSEKFASGQRLEQRADGWEKFGASAGDSSSSEDEGSNPHEFTFSAESSAMVDQVRMLQHIHACAHAEDELAGGEAGGIMRATAGGMKPRVLKATTPIHDIYKAEGPIEDDVESMQADWPLTWTHVTLAAGVSVGSGIAGPEDVTMLAQATTATAILCLQGEESMESFGVRWEGIQEQAERCDVAVFRVPVPEFDEQKQAGGIVEAVRLLASLLVTGHRVHVACATGKHCSPLVVLGYLTFFQGLAWSEAKAIIVDSLPSADPPQAAWEEARLLLTAADGNGAHRMTELAEEQYQRRIEEGTGAVGAATARDDWEEAQRRLITETLQQRVSADVTISQSLSKAASRQVPSSPKTSEPQSPTPLSPQQSFSRLEAQIDPFPDAAAHYQPHILDSVYSFANDHHAHAWPLAAPPPADTPPAYAAPAAVVPGEAFPGEGASGEGDSGEGDPGEGVFGEVSAAVEGRIAALEQKHLAAMAAARSATEQVRFFMQQVTELRQREAAAREEAAAAHDRIATLSTQVESLNLQQLQQSEEHLLDQQQFQLEHQASLALTVDSAAAAAAAAEAAAAAAAAARADAAEATAAAVAAATAEAEAAAAVAAAAAAAAASERESALSSQLSDFSNEISLLRGREGELLAAQEAAEARAQAAEERAADLAKRISQMEEMESAAKEAAAAALERMQALAEQVKELSEKERAATARAGEMEGQLEEASQKAAADHDLMVKLEDRAERAEREARKAQEALGAANERVKFFFRVMRGLRDRERAAKEAMHAATDRLEAAVTEAEGLRRKDELMREAWAVASERIELLTRQVQQVEGLKSEAKRAAVDAAREFLHASDATAFAGNSDRGDDGIYDADGGGGGASRRLLVAREGLAEAEERERMLQAQLDALAAELAAARGDVAERDARLAAVAAEVAERERAIEASREAVAVAERQVREMEEQVKEAGERESKAKEEAAEAEAKLTAALAAAAAKEKEEEAGTEGLLAGLPASATAATAAGVAASSAADELIARLQSQVATMSRELEGARFAAAAAGERSAFLIRQVARLKERAAADAVARTRGDSGIGGGGGGGGKGEEMKVRHKVAALEVEIRALESRERAARAEAEAEKARVRALESQVGQLENKERAAREKLQTSQDRVGFFLRQAVQLREREEASKSALKETFRKVEGLSQQVGVLEGELVRASSVSGKSTDAVERLKLLTMELKERVQETSEAASSIRATLIGRGNLSVDRLPRRSRQLEADSVRKTCPALEAALESTDSPRIQETSKAASSIRKQPPRASGAAQKQQAPVKAKEGGQLNGALKAPALDAPNGASNGAVTGASNGALNGAAHSTSSNGAVKAGASTKGRGRAEKEKKEDDNDDDSFGGPSLGGGGGGVGGGGSGGRLAGNASQTPSPSFGALKLSQDIASRGISPSHSSFEHAAAAVTIAAAAAVGSAAAGAEFLEFSETATLVAMVTTLQTQASSLLSSRQTALATVAASHWLPHSLQAHHPSVSSPTSLSAPLPSSPSPLHSLQAALTSLAIPIPFPRLTLPQLPFSKRPSGLPQNPSLDKPSPGNAGGGELGWVAAAVLVLLPLLLLGPSDALGM